MERLGKHEVLVHDGAVSYVNKLSIYKSRKGYFIRDIHNKPLYIVKKLNPPQQHGPFTVHYEADCSL